MTDKKFTVILAAAGKSTRFGGAQSKIHALLAGKPLWQHSVEIFASFSNVIQILMVISPADRPDFEQNHLSKLKKSQLFLVDGGVERFHSVSHALKYVSEEADYIAIHDAARPCVDRERIEQVFQTAVQTGAAILANPVVGTLKRTGKQHQILETVDRADLWEAQTPQVFRKALFLEAMNQRNDQPVTDDAQLFEMAGIPVEIVPSERDNLKITTQNDIVLAEHLIKSRTQTGEQTP